MEAILIDDPEGWDEFVENLSLTQVEDKPLDHLTAMIHLVNQNLDKENDVERLRMSTEMVRVLAEALETRANAIEEEHGVSEH